MRDAPHASLQASLPVDETELKGEKLGENDPAARRQNLVLLVGEVDEPQRITAGHQAVLGANVLRQGIHDRAGPLQRVPYETAKLVRGEIRGRRVDGDDAPDVEGLLS